MNDDRLIKLLQTLEESIPEQGFTESVLARLPKKQAVRWRIPLFGSAYLLAGALVLALFPFDHLSGIAPLLMTAPWLAVAIAAAIVGSSWILGQEFIGQ